MTAVDNYGHGPIFDTQMCAVVRVQLTIFGSIILGCAVIAAAIVAAAAVVASRIQAEAAKPETIDG